MDFQSIQMPLIFVALFSIGSVLLILINKLGIKEKSYEEALAEQRLQNQALLGVKPKPKEKKVKKISKKNKDKATSKESVGSLDEAEPADVVQASEVQKKPQIDEDETVKVTTSKKQTKKVYPKSEDTEARKQFTEDPSVEVKTDPEPPKPANDKSKEVVVKSEFIPQVAKKQSESVKASPTREPPSNGIVNNAGKEKKKKKSEFNTLQQLATNTNITVLLNLVRKAELSRSEVQILIDLLLNKQHDAPIISDEWSEGKADAVQKLKRQLAEKEKLLVEQQEIVTSAQNKLREVRAENQSERSVLQQKLRGADEVLQAKQIELGRLHQQVQQLQGQVNEESLKNHNLREEYAAMQMQRQQFEMRLGQVQESEVIMTQLQNEVQELSSINSQMRMELARFTEENRAEKERNQSLIGQLSSFQKELEQKSERNCQLEESRLNLERDLESVLKRENNLKTEISRFGSIVQQQIEEIRRLEHGKKQQIDEIQKQKDETIKLITELEADLRHAQEEKAQIQVTHMNGSLRESKQYEVEILNLQNELSSVKTQSEVELKTAAKTAETLRSEMEELKRKLQEEQAKLEEQKTKNNVLRTKNWKVMEALNATQNRTKTNVPIQTKSDKDVERDFIRRLFPEIKDKQVTDLAVFELEGETFIRNYVESLRKSSQNEQSSDSDTVQLKSQLHYYKNVIDNTEKMLNNLQTHIQQEELNWRTQLTAKTAELEALKESQGGDLQQQLKTLEEKLKSEQEDKLNLVAQLQKFKNSPGSVEFLLDAQNPSNSLH